MQLDIVSEAVGAHLRARGILNNRETSQSFHNRLRRSFNPYAVPRPLTKYSQIPFINERKMSFFLCCRKIKRDWLNTVLKKTKQQKKTIYSNLPEACDAWRLELFSTTAIIVSFLLGLHEPSSTRTFISCAHELLLRLTWVKVCWSTVMLGSLVRVRASADTSLSPTVFRAVSEQYQSTFRVLLE